MQGLYARVGQKKQTKKGRWLILWMTTNADNMHLWFCSNSLQFSFFFFGYL